jgi:hypothetical protein
MDIGFELTKRQEGLLENSNPKYLRHYTRLPYLLKILETKQLKLGDSKNFKDKIDKKWTDAYKDKSKNPDLYALCFTWETELIHHWNTYAKGEIGCCITFDGTALIEAAKEQGIVARFVYYRKNIPWKNIPDDIPAEEIPFTKAWAYRCEYEYRFTSTGVKYMAIDIAWIKQITLSPHTDEDTFDFFKKSIGKTYSGQVSRSRLESGE